MCSRCNGRARCSTTATYYCPPPRVPASVSSPGSSSCFCCSASCRSLRRRAAPTGITSQFTASRALCRHLIASTTARLWQISRPLARPRSPILFNPCSRLDRPHRDCTSSRLPPAEETQFPFSLCEHCRILDFRPSQPSRRSLLTARRVLNPTILYHGRRHSLSVAGRREGCRRRESCCSTASQDWLQQPQHEWPALHADVWQRSPGAEAQAQGGRHLETACSLVC